jgi:hypothetical protein
MRKEGWMQYQMSEDEYHTALGDATYRYVTNDNPSPRVAIDYLVHFLARVLVFFIRRGQHMPDEVESILEQVCGDLRERTMDYLSEADSREDDAL